jgi:hypothetical protein
MVAVIKPMYSVSLFGIVTVNPPYNEYILFQKSEKKET